jgi:5-methyltetrahydrofolate--homocysteine methyltransferase
VQDTRERLESILRQRIAVLDGSWGVLIQKRVRGEDAYRGDRFRDHPLDVAGDPDLLNLTQPEIVRDIHRSYFAAGADLATTNTFTATRIGQADYGLQEVAAEMALEGARLAREVADEFGGLVAGSLGPLNVSLSLSPRVDDPAYRSATFDEVLEAYAEQVRALRDGGVDLLLIETVFDTLNAKAAIVAAQDEARPRCAPSSRTSLSSRRRGSPAIPMPACRTRSASTTSSPRTRAASSRSSPATAS